MMAVHQETTPDLHPETLDALAKLMLAQAQEVIAYKCIRGECHLSPAPAPPHTHTRAISTRPPTCCRRHEGQHGGQGVRALRRAVLGRPARHAEGAAQVAVGARLAQHREYTHRDTPELLYLPAQLIANLAPPLPYCRG